MIRSEARQMRVAPRSLVVSLALAAGLAGVASAQDMNAAMSGAAVNPHSPRYNHPYRHGVVPTKEQHALMKEWAARNHIGYATGTQTLAYGGGVDGIGVTTGVPKVYLVVYGTQWGTQGTDANGNLTFTGDTVGAVPYLQQLFKGLGTGGETWSAVMTQYCEGVSAGATSCPTSGVARVGMPTNGVLAGIWYDNSAASPSAATGHQLAVEAVKAAGHFGNTTAASNRLAQYIILSPTGTKPDGFNTPNGGFCAWHDWNGDTSLSGGAATSSYGDIAFHNMPYVYDMGSSCGANSVRDNRDGFSIVDGHEYAELITDQNPAGGWTNQTGSSSNGQENADECAWITSGQGATALVTMGNGSYPMQSTWSNDTNRCDITHAVIGGGGGGGGGTPTANFTFTTSGLTATFTDTSTDTGGTLSSHSWTFGDGSTSTATNPSHTYATANTYTVTETVTDSVNGTTSSKSSSVTVSSGGGGSSQLLGNTGFESGTAAPWTMSSGVLCTNTACTGETAHAGTGFAWLDGYGSSHTDTVSQSVAITAGKSSATLSFYLHIDTKESGSTAYDTLKVQVLNSSGTVLSTLATYSNVNAASGYVLKSFNLNAYIGQTVTIKFTGTEDSSLATSFVLDDVTLTVQ